MTGQIEDASAVEPAVPPVPLGHSATRPLTLLVWDAPNMDVALHEITSLDEIVRPNFSAVTSWLCGQAAAGTDVEAMLFTAIVQGRAQQMLPWVQALRSAGFSTFARSRHGGDIDDAFVVACSARLDERHAPGLLVLATHDQELAGPLGDRAAAAGWRVVQLGYQEASGWVGGRPGWGFTDVETIPSAFSRPLVRLSLDHLPPEGRWIPPSTHLTPRPAVSGDFVGQFVAFCESVVTDGTPVLLSQLGHMARSAFGHFVDQAAPFGKLQGLAKLVVQRSTVLELLEVGTAEARLSRRSGDRSVSVGTGPADVVPAELGSGETGPAECGPAEFGPAETGSGGIGSAEIDPAGIDPVEVVPAEIGSGVVDVGSSPGWPPDATIDLDAVADDVAVDER